MDKMTSSDAWEIPAESEATLAELLAEMQALNEQMKKDQVDIDRLKAETEALKSALLELPAEGKVMALGGGAFNSPENAAMLDEVGLITILLQAPIEELYRRCEEQTLERPLRRSFEEFCKLHEQRIPAYRRATFAVETLGKPVQEVANEIIRLLGRS